MSVTRERLGNLPESPGVYLMKDHAGVVVYVGKAKNLFNRVRSYFSGGDSRQSIPYLLERVDSIETIVTQSERQALILELDLIRKYKPRYNIRLKDDRAHYLVRIDLEQEWPRIELVRRTAEDGARYLGPFPFSYELRTILDVIKRSIPLRTCSDRVLNNRVRPCLEYQIKRCSGPCCLPVDREQYRAWVKQAIAILEGRNAEVVETLNIEMEIASSQLRFEDAAIIRDRLQVLQTMREDRTAVLFGELNVDAFALHRELERAEVAVLFVRGGRIVESKSFGLEDVHIPNEEVLAQILSEFYGGAHDIPPYILLPYHLEDTTIRQELLSERAGRTTKISVPTGGTKLRLLQLAEVNARENFNARFAALRSREDTLRLLAEELALPEIPRVIECVDVSHFQGGSTVGSVVVFQDGEPDRTRYRSMYLSQEGKPDDFASMRELVGRHLSRSVEENTLPDLIVVDGGPAQLEQAVKVRAELGLARPTLIGLAKKRGYRASYRAPDVLAKPERVYLENDTSPIVLAVGTSPLLLLERIRDEAHRTAVTFHRRSRSRRQFQSPLDRIPGIGEKRKRLLLRAFGSAKHIAAASPAVIVERTGIPESLARRIIELLQRVDD